MTKQRTIPKTKSNRIPNCRVIEVGVEHFAECLQQGPQPCSHALPFGYCFLCTHPNVDELIANSKKAEMMARAIG